jgi:hypothetical protein
MGLAVISLSPVEGALTLYLTYYRLPAILSINLFGPPRGSGFMGRPATRTVNCRKAKA